jgi:hypothetical protein
MANAKSKAEKKVKPVDGVEIEWTGKSQFHKEGETSIVHTVQADKLVEKGLAKLVKGGKTETKPISNEDGSTI